MNLSKNFSHWCKWDNRDSLKNIDLPGLYILAFNKKSNDPVNPKDPNIIYIGETCSKKGLKGRWNQFERSAFHGKPGHSGGTSYREREYHKRKRLCVAAFPVKKREPTLRNAYIRFVERKLIWDFIKENGGGELLNKK